MAGAGVLDILSVREAINLQFKLVDCIHRHFPNDSFLELGDLGLSFSGRPRRTAIVEDVIAEFFSAEACVLVRGSGTGAIRASLEALVKTGDTVLVHDAPIYPSTASTLQSMGLNVVSADYNNLKDIKKVLLEQKPVLAIVQHSRQLITDTYDMREVIAIINELKDCRVLVDDNYAVFRDPVDGISAGADISAFSMFKLQGPQGIGCLLGKKKIIEKVHEHMCTGGTQVQGFEAMEALRGLVIAPVLMAVQSEEIDKIKLGVEKLIDEGGWPIRNVFIANMQSRVILVEFSLPIARKVIAAAVTLGASSKPVGAESKYEIPALFYKASRTFLAGDDGKQDYYLRINPMRAGSGTILRILKESIMKAVQED